MSNYPENWLTDSPVIEILEEDRIPKQVVIGQKYHTSWQYNTKMCWILRGVNNEGIALMEAPRAKTQFITDVHTLRHLKKDAQRNANIRVRNKLRREQNRQQSLNPNNQ